MIDDADIRLLVAGGALDAAVETICKHFPKIRTVACGSGKDFARTVDRFRPNVAYITKSKSIGRRDWTRVLGSADLRWLSLGNVGFDHVPAWNRKKLLVTNAGGVAAEAMSEFAIGAMMMVNAGFISYFRYQTVRRWQKREWVPLAGQTVAVVGVGKIGRLIIDRARRLGMRVVAVRASRRATPGAHRTFSPGGIGQALNMADFVSVQVPLNNWTKGLIGSAALAHMRATAWLINISRGGVIDERALLAALRAHRIGGAVLDVFRTEPLPKKSPFWALPNVVITPHVSGEIVGYYDAVTAGFCRNLRRLKSGLPLENLI